MANPDLQRRYAPGDLVPSNQIRSSHVGDFNKADGVIVGWGPELDSRALGFGVLAFCTLQIAQGVHDPTIEALAEIAEVTEIHTVTGDGDLLVRIVARSNDHLHEVLMTVTSLPAVRHSHTQLALATGHRRPVVDAL